MNYRKDFLLKIEEYLKGYLDRYSLYKYACRIDKEILMSGQIMYIDNLIVAQLLYPLTLKPDIEETLSDNEIQEIAEILNYKINYSKTIFIRIIQNHKSKSLKNINRILSYYKKNNRFREIDYENLYNLSIASRSEICLSINDLVYNQAIQLASTLPFRKDMGITANSLFFNAEKELEVEKIIKKVENLINCYEGRNALYANIQIQGSNTLVYISPIE